MSTLGANEHITQDLVTPRGRFHLTRAAGYAQAEEVRYAYIISHSAD
jgi:hypothetical protein